MNIETLEPRCLLFAGQFETTFGVGGETTLPGFGETDRLQEVVATFTDDATGLENVLLRFEGDWLARLDIGGRFVSGFGTDGVIDLDATLGAIEVIDTAYNADTGRIALLSVENVSGDDRFTLREIDTDGTLVADFGGGRVVLDVTFDDAQKVAYRADGSVVVAGIANTVDGVNTDDGNLILAGYRSDGALTTGLGVQTFGVTEGVNVSLLKSDRNNILYVGLLDQQFDGFVTAERAHLLRVDFNGEFNAASDQITYDADGTTREDMVLDVLDTDGTAEGIRVLVATDTDSTVSNDFASEQALTTETLTIDAPFDAGTPALALQDPTEFVYVTGAQFDASGRVVAVGLRDGEPVPFAATRFAADGTYDLTYGSTGFTEFTGRPVLLDDARVLNLDSTPADGGDPVLGLLQSGDGQTVGGTVEIVRSGSRATITGSAGNDSVRVSFRESDDRLVIRGNGETTSIPLVAGLSISLGDGNDEVIFAANVPAISSPAAPSIGITGGAGNDTIRGSAGSDSVLGEGDDDFLYGFGEADYLFGGAGNDFIFGGDGDDYAEGGSGDDSLNGNAQNDRLLGNSGFDTINGAGGNDFLFGGANADDIRGGAGNDKAANDVLDTYDSVEELLA